MARLAPAKRRDLYFRADDEWAPDAPPWTAIYPTFARRLTAERLEEVFRIVAGAMKMRAAERMADRADDRCGGPMISTLELYKIEEK